MLGVSADTLHSFRVDSNEAAYEKVFADALFKQYLCRVRVKQELVNDEMRTKSSGLRVDEVDLVNECHQMIEAIKKYA
ncbi:hypothetical protein EON65_21385 [archaeon]|nr:MAG: hypothetical protein EON65_21385 [archaeon]